MSDEASLKSTTERLERVLADARQALGDEHPQTLTAMLDLAEALWAQGRLIAARKLEEQVVAGRRSLLGEDHADTLKAIGKLAVTLAAQGDLARARRLQEEVVAGLRAQGMRAQGMRVHGVETGRDTLRAINNLAGTLAAQGDLAGARELLQSVISAMVRQHGEQHPDTLAAMGNLAAVLWQEGERAEAYELQRQVVELRRRTGDGTDQTALLAAAVLDMMERDTGF